jgi:2-keto-4-pentenoate hydratase/2-oxohepta-3-ene-1,7-dioic acid hydratase in catechol pathway
MRLVSFGDHGTEQAGVLVDNGTAVIPIAALDPALPRTVKGLLAGNCRSRLEACLAGYGGRPIPRSSVRLGPPVTDPGSIICVGLNYHDHAREQGLKTPERPLIFAKAVGTLAGCEDPIELPPDDGEPDFEVELAMVIGRTCRHVAAADAFSVIAGYMVGNDITCRLWQRTEGQWFRAKSSDTFYPCGPALVTADEVPDPRVLRLTTDVDGKRFQNGSVTDQIHDIPTLIAWLTRTMTLHPGDIISTGTPAGAGIGQHPPRFLRAGEVVTCAIAGGGVDLGRLVNPVVAPRSA